MADPPHYFNRRSAEKIGRTVNRVLREPRPRERRDIPVYPMGRELIPFKLKTALTSTGLGSSATAFLIKSIGSTDGAITASTSSFNVYDDVYGTLDGSTGAQGFFQFHGPDRRVIVTLNCTGG